MHMVMDYQKVLELAENHRTIPVFRDVYSDLITPVSILKKLEAKSSRCFLLESVEEGKNWGRYSFLGFNPIMRVSGRKNTVTIEKDLEVQQLIIQQPLDVLRRILSEYNPPKLEDMPPFTGGFVGYFAYSMFHLREPKLKLREGEFNDFDLMLFTRVIVFDHLRQKIRIIINIDRENLKENYDRAVKDMEELESLFFKPMQPAVVTGERVDRLFSSNIPGLNLTHSDTVTAFEGFQCDMTKQEYCNAVERAKRYIREGDIFQAVISRSFSATMSGSLLNAYRVLRTTNPSPYMVYLKIDDVELMCSSPETLIRLRDGILTTFPVAGSRPRGSTKQEDERLERELLSDEKELAEHNMLVDLARNDLGSISRIGSVRVAEYMTIHRYSKIMHICSRVEGNILPGYDALHAIEAVLPAGTLSGAPKIRACEIIEELETGPRGIYGGALGYIDFSGEMDTCIAIRMAVKKGDTVIIRAGGGIVADSIPEREYEESGNKAAAVMNAVLQAKEVEGL